MSEPGVLGYLRFVSELAAAPDLVDRLLADHPVDEQGLCAGRFCGRPGCGSRYLPWPCPTRRLADLARAIHVSRLGTPTRSTPSSGKPRSGRERT